MPDDPAFGQSGSGLRTKILATPESVRHIFLVRFRSVMTLIGADRRNSVMTVQGNYEKMLLQNCVQLETNTAYAITSSFIH
jgi:hypothetical protein